ncbi:MAG: hotdog fold domain-containing protein [Pseudomonadota bacterium]
MVRTLPIWQTLADKPLGKWLFSRVLCFKAPYFATIRPRFQALRPGYSEITFGKRRAVLNHIGTVHAIAMCNAAELVAGTMTDVTIPASHRWIPKGMRVEYLQKATSTLRAVATPAPGAAPDREGDYEVHVDVTDAEGTTVLHAVITMWVTPRSR